MRLEHPCSDSNVLTHPSQAEIDIPQSIYRFHLCAESKASGIISELIASVQPPSYALGNPRVKLRAEGRLDSNVCFTHVEANTDGWWNRPCR